MDIASWVAVQSIGILVYCAEGPALKSRVAAGTAERDTSIKFSKLVEMDPEESLTAQGHEGPFITDTNVLSLLVKDRLNRN